MTKPAVFRAPEAAPMPTTSPSPSLLIRTILPRAAAPAQSGLAQLLADNPGTFPYVENGQVSMWPAAPSRDAYRLVTGGPLEALEALAAGEPPVLWDRDHVPDLAEISEAIERQWSAPSSGVPLFVGAPAGGGFEANVAHPLWRLLVGADE